MERVRSGAEVCCVPVKQAIARQLRDLERSESDPNFPYYFDDEEARDVLDILSLLKCTSGEWKGKPLVLSDFQEWRIAVVFGWRRKDDKTRRFRRAYVEVARKNGKTEEAAAISVFGLFADGEQTGQVYSAATTRPQAKIVFNAAKIMLRLLAKESKHIRERIQSLAHRVVDKVTDSFMEALSSDAWTLDGLSPSIAIIDEYHAHPTSEVLKVIETGMGARAQPLTYIITTAGYDTEGPCFQLRESAMNILAGKLEDDTFFSIIYTLDEGDDWNDESVWVKANPNIGITPKWNFMRSEYTKARNEGKSTEIEFKTKNLNVWVRSRTGWIQDELWQACPAQIDMQALRGKKCYMGVDLANTSDFCSLALMFPGLEGEPHTFLWYHWLPEAAFEARWRKIPVIQDWKEAGYVEVVPGNVMEFEYIERRILECVGLYDVEVVGCDPRSAHQMASKLITLGVPMDMFAQDIRNMSEPSKAFERLVKKGDINHGGNPVVRWMLGNVHIYTDANDNIKLHKGKSVDKIDGVVAAIIALGEWITKPVAQKSYLEENDLIYV